MTILSERGVRVASGRPSRALRALPHTAFVLDFAVLLAATFVAAVAHLQFESVTGSSGEYVRWFWAVVLVGWLLAISLFDGYDKHVFGAGTDEYKRLVHAGVLAAGLTGLGCFLVDYSLSRVYFVTVFGVGIPALVVGRKLLRRAVHRARIRGSLLNRVLIAGSPSHVDDVARVLRREKWLGYQVVGALTSPMVVTEETPGGVPVLGTTEEISWSVAASQADVLFVAGGAVESAQELRRIAWDLEREDVQVVVAPSLTDVSGERVRIRPVGGVPLIHVDPPRAIHASRWAKRLFDILGSAALLVVFSPVMLVAAVRIRLHDGGPVLFRQTRVGKDGAEFSCLKFRSMVVNAEELLPELHEQAGYESGLFKLKEDPRITKPGAWLRKHSFDELPQLINVLRGEMSLVGPRPPLPIEVERYERDANRRLNIRPGLTGLWQVSGRSDLSWEETIRLDLYYVDNWSMLQDINILLKTVHAVARPTGAY